MPSSPQNVVDLISSMPGSYPDLPSTAPNFELQEQSLRSSPTTITRNSVLRFPRTFPSAPIDTFDQDDWPTGYAKRTVAGLQSLPVNFHELIIQDLSKHEAGRDALQVLWSTSEHWHNIAKEIHRKITNKRRRRKELRRLLQAELLTDAIPSSAIQDIPSNDTSTNAAPTNATPTIVMPTATRRLRLYSPTPLASGVTFVDGLTISFALLHVSQSPAHGPDILLFSFDH